MRGIKIFLRWLSYSFGAASMLVFAAGIAIVFIKGIKEFWIEVFHSDLGNALVALFAFCGVTFIISEIIECVLEWRS